MSDEAALLAAIAADLDDDGPRLVLADWLAERGDPRGELVHLQLARAAMLAGDDRIKQTDKRIEELLDEHGDRWLGRLRELRQRDLAFHFHRGVIGAVRTSAATLVRNAAQIVAAAPLLTRVTIATTREDNDLAKLAGTALLARLRELEVETFQAHRLTGLVGLDFPELRSLGFSTITHGAGDLAILGRMPKLTALRFFHCKFNKGVVESLGALPAGMRSLDATAMHLGPRLGQLAARWTDLVEVGFAGNQLTSAGLASLLPALAHATHVNLRGNELVTADLPALLDAIPSATVLELGGNPLGDEGAALIARHPVATRLTRLHVGETGLTREGARTFAASPNLANLRSLVLTGRRFDPATEAILVGSPHLANARIYGGDRLLARPKKGTL